MARGDCPECGTPGFEFYKRCHECGHSAPVALLGHAEKLAVEIDQHERGSDERLRLLDQLREQLERCEGIVGAATSEARAIVTRAQAEASQIRANVEKEAEETRKEWERITGALKLQSRLEIQAIQSAAERSLHREIHAIRQEHRERTIRLLRAYRTRVRALRHELYQNALRHQRETREPMRHTELARATTCITTEASNSLNPITPPRFTDGLLRLWPLLPLLVAITLATQC